MQAQTLCAQVAATLGEPRRLVELRGFQLDKPVKPLAGARLPAIDCPFCGQQVLVAPPPSGSFDAECRGCDAAFEAVADEVYLTTLRAAHKPRPRWFAGGL